MIDYRTLNEQDLLVRLKDRDSLAFEEIYSRSWRILYAAAFNRLKNRETCQDIIHDVFADLWNKCDSKTIDDLMPYLHTAVKYKIFTFLAKGIHSQYFVEPFESMAFSSINADSYLNSKELESLIMSWIEILPNKRRRVFQMKFIDNLSTKEISKRLSVSQKTVQNQVTTTYNELRFYIAQYLLIALIIIFFS